MTRRLCEHDGCNKRQSFDMEGGKGRFCVKHKEDGMVDVKNKRCEHAECSSQPSFDMEGGKGRFCVKHKQEGMVDVKNKRCEHDGCKSINPTFDTEGRKGRFCLKHKEDGMVNVKNKRCAHDECSSHPVFDMEGGKGRFCVKHKQEGMVDVKTKRCEHDGCKSINPTFDTEGRKGRFCLKHKEDGMVNVRSKKCEHDECSSQPSFDMEGGKGRFCVKHKQEGMVDVKNKRCKHDGCKSINPTFDTEGRKGRFCVKHKEDGMVNVKSKRCLLCPTFVSNKLYKGHCYRCFINTFPDNTIIRNHKTKERTVADFIKEHFSCYDISFDKRIDGGCSSRRPDILIDLGHRVIIIEIDENQHGTYDCSCENKRLMQLFQDAGMRRMTFVRFNPDQYYDCKEGSNSSCWGITANTGVFVVKDGKKKEWDRRLNVLKEHVQHACENGGEKDIDIVYLFYDGWMDSQFMTPKNDTSNRLKRCIKKERAHTS